MEPLQTELKYKIGQATQIVTSYKWLIDAYMVDFYQQDHWSKLPSSWARCLADIPVRSFSQLLSFDPKDEELLVWPLAIIALRSLFRMLGHTRTKSYESTKGETMDEIHVNNVYSEQKALFQKSVKLKKRHEIEQFAINCSTEETNNCKTIVDIGSGQGNLARTLAYGFGFQVCCIEQNISFVQIARQKDAELWKRLVKYDPCLENTVVHPVHLHEKIDLDHIDSVKFVQMLKTELNVSRADEDEFSFGLVGLHPCGDLAPSLLRLFHACQECRFIKLVCCCYMKLSSIDSSLSNPSRIYGFPLSEFCHTTRVTLTYQAREIACHAIELYREKLLTNCRELKVHAYRAAIETIIVRMRPDLRHSGLKGGIKASEVTFEEYCLRAVYDLDLVIAKEALHGEDIRQLLNRWEQVVKFYTLRLMFAPLVETIILYDRVLFLLEKGIRAGIDVIFDPFLSPRNHAITAIK